MKIRATLPDKKHYQLIPSKKEGCFSWVDKASPLVEIRSLVSDPWDKEWDIVFFVEKGKTRAGNRPTKSLTLMCYSPDERTQPGSIIRDRWKGKIFHSVEPCFAFYAVNCDEDFNQLLYTVVSMPEKPGLSVNAFEERLIELGIFE